MSKEIIALTTQESINLAIYSILTAKQQHALIHTLFIDSILSSTEIASLFNITPNAVLDILHINPDKGNIVTRIGKLIRVIIYKLKSL